MKKRKKRWSTKKIKKKDKSRNEKGELLERIVALLHQSDANLRVQKNVFLPPLRAVSGRKREIDVLLTGNVAGYPIRVAIQCKNQADPVEVGQIGEFRDLLEDVGIPTQHAIVIGVKGFRSGAKERAKELGIRTFVLEGLSSSRLMTEVYECFQYFVHLLLVVDQMNMTTEVPDIHAWSFWGEDGIFCGMFTDLIVSKWRNGEIPTKLGIHDLELDLPHGWFQRLGERYVLPSSLSAKIRVVGYVAEMPGKYSRLSLKDADTNEVERWQIKVDFSALKELIKTTKEDAILSEQELGAIKGRTAVSIEHRIRLPKIFIRNHLEPFSAKAWENFLKETDGLSFAEVENLPLKSIEEMEGDTKAPMEEPAAMGEPVILRNQSGELVDVRLLVRQGKFSEVSKLHPLITKYPRRDFAEFLEASLVLHGAHLMANSLSGSGETAEIVQEEAFRCFERAVKLSSNKLDTIIDVSKVLTSHSFFDKALEYLENFLGVEPDDLVANCIKADILVQKGDFETASLLLDSLLCNHSTFPALLFLVRARISEHGLHFSDAAADLFHVWETDYLYIVEERAIRSLVYRIREKHSVVSTGLMTADCLVQAASENKDDLSASQECLEASIAALQMVKTAIEKAKLEDTVRAMYSAVVTRLVNCIDSLPMEFTSKETRMIVSTLDLTSNLDSVDESADRD